MFLLFLWTDEDEMAGRLQNLMNVDEVRKIVSQNSVPELRSDFKCPCDQK